MATPRSLTGQSKSMVVHEPTSPLINDREPKPICDQKGTNRSVRNPVIVGSKFGLMNVGQTSPIGRQKLPVGTVRKLRPRRKGL